MGSPSVEILIDSFIDSLIAEKGYSENTCRAYLTDLKEFESFSEQNSRTGTVKRRQAGGFTPASIDSLTVRKYLGYLHRKNKKTTIARNLSAVRSFFRYLVKQGPTARAVTSLAAKMNTKTTSSRPSRPGSHVRRRLGQRTAASGSGTKYLW